MVTLLYSAPFGGIERPEPGQRTNQRKLPFFAHFLNSKRGQDHQGLLGGFVLLWYINTSILPPAGDVYSFFYATLKVLSEQDLV